MNQRFVGTYRLHLQGLKSTEQETDLLAATFRTDVYSETKHFLYLALIFLFFPEEKEGFS
jgi:hypothetical protein